MRPRVLAYAWASPATAIGLVVALLACVRGRLRVHSGVVEADGPLLAWCLRSLVPIRGGAAALTIGHVVIGRDGEALADTRAHERVHVGQYRTVGRVLPSRIPGGVTLGGGPRTGLLSGQSIRTRGACARARRYGIRASLVAKSPATGTNIEIAAACRRVDAIPPGGRRRLDGEEVLLRNSVMSEATARSISASAVAEGDRRRSTWRDRRGRPFRRSPLSPRV